jgi:hypothetical protein
MIIKNITYMLKKLSDIQKHSDGCNRRFLILLVPIGLGRPMLPPVFVLGVDSCPESMRLLQGWISEVKVERSLSTWLSTRDIAEHDAPTFSYAMM